MSKSPAPILFNPEEYPNHLKYFSITAKDILDQISGYSLHFFEEENEEVEHKIAFPLFIKPFYRFVFEKARIPTQEEFYKYYLTYYKNEYFATHPYDGIIYLGLQARIYRTYPSIVRDFYFNKLLENNSRGFKVVYNIDLDSHRDIDAMLIKDNVFWAACLFINTNKAEMARKWKENRHKRFGNVKYVPLSVKFNKENKFGDFYLYREQDVEQLFYLINHPHLIPTIPSD